MLDVDGVADVHHVHLWNLASDVPALSAHVVVAGEPLLRDAQRTADRVKATLAERFALTNVTVELDAGRPLRPRRPRGDTVTTAPVRGAPRALGVANTARQRLAAMVFGTVPTVRGSPCVHRVTAFGSVGVATPVPCVADGGEGALDGAPYWRQAAVRQVHASSGFIARTSTSAGW